MRTYRNNPRNRPLQVEPLESLTLLSTIPVMGLARGPALVSNHAAQQVNFNAMTTGQFYTTQSNPDTGKDYHVFTTGKTSGGGVVSVGGELITPGFIRGRTTGTLTVVTSKGTLTLKVSGPLQQGPASLPPVLGFRITGGTGAYARHHSGGGTIGVDYHVTSTSSGNSLSMFHQFGTISLDFQAGPSVV